MSSTLLKTLLLTEEDSEDEDEPDEEKQYAKRFRTGERMKFVSTPREIRTSPRTRLLEKDKETATRMRNPFTSFIGEEDAHDPFV